MQLPANTSDFWVETSDEVNMSNIFLSAPTQNVTYRLDAGAQTIPARTIPAHTIPGGMPGEEIPLRSSRPAHTIPAHTIPAHTEIVLTLTQVK